MSTKNCKELLGPSLDALYYETNGKSFLITSEQFQAGMEYARWFDKLPLAAQEAHENAISRTEAELERHNKSIRKKYDNRPELLKHLTNTKTTN